MKTLLTVAMLCAAFYAGTHYVVQPREQAACQAAPARRQAKAPAPVKARAKPVSSAVDLGF